MKLKYILIFLFVIFCPIQGNADRKTVSLATSDWVPYVDESLGNNGFISEIVTKVFKQNGYKTSIHFMPWIRAVRKTEEGKFDAFFPAYYTKERGKNFYISNSIFKSRLGFYKRKDSNITHKTLDDLKPYRIGVVRGYANSPEFDAADFLKKDIANSDLVNLKKLLTKRVDLIVIDELLAKYLTKKSLKEGMEQLEFMEPPLEEKPVYLLVSKKVNGAEEIVKEFNAGLQAISKDGTLNNIIRAGGLSSYSVSSNNKITLRANEWCPFNCEPYSEKPGFLIEIAKYVFEKEGKQIDYQTMNWDRTIKGVREGKFAGAVGAAKKDRRGLVYPKTKQGLSQACFFVKKDSEWKFTGMNSLNSIQVGVIDGYAYWEEINHYIADNLKSGKIQVAYGDAPLKRNTQKLLKDRVGAVLAFRNVMKLLLKDSGQGELIKEAGCGPEQDIYIAFSPELTEAKEYAKLLSDGMAELRSTGRLKTILESYGLEDWE